MLWPVFPVVGQLNRAGEAEEAEVASLLIMLPREGEGEGGGRGGVMYPEHNKTQKRAGGC